MRRAFIAEEYLPVGGTFTLGFTLHQHLHAIGEQGDFLFLPRNDV